VDEANEQNGDPVDWEVFFRARADLGAGFAKILSYFREDGAISVARIEEAMHRKDAAGLVLPAHTMKSEARQFGAEPLGALAEDIEICARRAVEMRYFPDELVPQVARLRPLYRHTMALLDAEANPLRTRPGS
jgi:HPt (histidine-containing phosphotransfer) domain-containing protein